MVRLETKSIQEPKIINWQVKEGKIIVLLEDGREIIIPFQLLTKWGILDKEVKPEQLIKYEIKGEGNIIYFPDIDDILPTRKIIKGLHTC